MTLAWSAQATADYPIWQPGILSGPVYRGPMCPDGFACESGAELRDYFALERLPDGRVASVWTSTEDIPGKIVNVYGATDLPLLSA